MDDADDNSSTTTLSSERNILDPRPSIAKTSISIARIEDEVSNSMSRLRIASGYLKPVIDEIISRATSYTQLEFKELLEKESPICSISVEQFQHACKASEIIGTNPYFREYVVNTVADINEDRILIDRDLLKQLVDLQAMILATIDRLKDTVVEDMDVAQVRKELEENFVIVDKVDQKGEVVEQSLSTLMNDVNTLTVENGNKKLKKEEYDKVSDITAMVPTSSDIYVNFGRKVASREEPKSDDESELILKTELDEVEASPPLPASTADETCGCELPDGNHGKCKERMQGFQRELEDMKGVVRRLTEEIATLKGCKEPSPSAGCPYAAKAPTSPSPGCPCSTAPASSSPGYPCASKNVPQEDLECEILDCLKELRQIKDVLARMNNPDLTLDKPVRTGDDPCCNLCNFPHIHAKLNGIPVIIKLNKSSIDILLSEDDKPKADDRRCRCTRQKQTEATCVTQVHSYVRTTYKSTPGPQQLKRDGNNTVVQSAFASKLGSELDFCDSLDGLPYVVNKKSLPSVSTCPSMDINVDQLKRNMRSNAIQHPNDRVQRSLAAMGVDKLIKASIPAECCREAVINEAERDEEPFHASINSLPLTNSDLRIITDPRNNAQRLEYYTNFQENIASNIQYYLPKSNVYEVRFFRVLRTKEQKSRMSLAEKLGEMLKRLIFNDADANSENAKETKNKKCQTDERITHKTRAVRHKLKKTSSHGKGKIKSSSVQCKIAECVGDGFNKTIKVHKYPSKLPVSKKYYNSNQSINQSSIFACNTNLGTIYESEERHHKKRVKKGLKHNKEPSLTDFMNSPSMSESFQKFLASDAAGKVLGGDQFLALYFEAKKSHRESGSQHDAKEDATFSVHRKRYKYRKGSASRIPRRIAKHTFSSTSTDGSSTKRVKRLKTQERLEKKELVVKVKPKVQPCEKKCEDAKNKPPQPSNSTTLSSADADKCGNEIAKKSAESSCSEYKPENSLESLQILASKNGPGYVTVLHPVCGCPDVSIFIPCYCKENSRSVLPREVVQKLVSRNDGRHIILPKCCRVEKYESGGEAIEDNG